MIISPHFSRWRIFKNPFNPSWKLTDYFLRALIPIYCIFNWNFPVLIFYKISLTTAELLVQEFLFSNYLKLLPWLFCPRQQNNLSANYLCYFIFPGFASCKNENKFKLKTSLKPFKNNNFQFNYLVKLLHTWYLYL